MTFRFSLGICRPSGLLCILQLGCAGSTAASGAVTPPPPAGSSKIIDRTNFNQIETANSAALKKLAKLRVFFAHASVGGNMVQGLQALNQADSSRYPLTIAQGSASTGGPEQQGPCMNSTAATRARRPRSASLLIASTFGRPAPMSMLSSTSSAINPDADFDAYTSSMQALKSAHPGTVVVLPNHSHLL